MARGGNSYFQFKQFRIEQDQCGMKVSTDACILGAWTEVKNAQRVLDIGAGTGLLSLMLAQRSEASIDAVEIDQSAYEQAQENIAKSPWSHRLSIYHQRIQDFRPVDGQSYDLIVSNPPFYPDHFPSDDPQKNGALHATLLSFEELLENILSLMSPQGRCVILLPERQMQDFTKLAAAKGLKLNRQLIVRDRQGKRILRLIHSFSQTETPLSSQELLIKNPEGSYSEDYTNLLKDYYLIF